MAHLDFQGLFCLVNQPFSDLVGYSQAELAQKSFTDIFHPEERDGEQQWIQQLIQRDVSSLSFEQRYIRRDGSIFWGNVTISLATTSSGKADYLIAILQDISDQKFIETRLRSSEQQMRAMFDAMHDLVLVCQVEEGEISDIEIAPTNLPIYEEIEIDPVSQTVEALWNSSENDWGMQIQKVLTTGQTVEFEYCLSINNQALWFMANISLMSEQTILWVARDISDRKQAEQVICQEKELAQVTLQSIGDAVITTDIHSTITQFNPVAEELTGWPTQEAQGQILSEIFNIVHEETREPAENPVQRALREGQIVQLANHTVLIARDGKEYAIEDSAAPILDRQGLLKGAVMVFYDVSQARHLKRQLSWQASHDPLTQLANRRKFDQILIDAFQSTQKDNQRHVLCFLDLDRFKVINDTNGHAAGDELLRQVATLLRKSIREIDTVARIGGDEFAILLYQCPLERATVIAENICQTVQDFYFHWANERLEIGISIGLVTLDQSSSSPQKVLEAADEACYIAKAKGRNQIQIHLSNDAS